MTAGGRKLALTAHVTSSLGWFGAVVGFLVLAIAGLTSRDPLRARASYLAMELIYRWAIVPLCVASLASGVVLSLGTPWGLVRHHWVVVKLVITAISTVVLIIHLQPMGQLADAAAHQVLAPADLRGLRIQLTIDAGAALAALIVATVLSVYKPRGTVPLLSRSGLTEPSNLA